MLSTMQDAYPLTIPAILRHAETQHADVRLSVYDGSAVTSRPYGDVIERIQRLSGALHAAGVRPGERVATFMWNSQPHLEAYFAVPAIGAVLHTINIRLFPEQVRFILGQAGDAAIIVDASLIETLLPVLAEAPSVRFAVITGDIDLAPVCSAVDFAVMGYEEFIATAKPRCGDVDDERTAASMCYTSGTTGDPKGVVYSHRSVYLHAMVNLTSAGFCIGDRDSLLQVVPMFHANGWGFPYAAWMGGAALILPDRHLQPEHLTRLIHTLRPTISGGVPTVWRGVFDYAHARSLDLTSLRTVSCAGSAVPERLLRDYQSIGVDLVQAWGMTETSPLAAIARPPALSRGRGEWYWRTRTGRAVPGIEMRIVGKRGELLPNDGQAIGELEIRGAWVAESYYADLGAEKFHDGWLRTGDVGTIDEYGAVKVTDRLKDLIKSGGEWISSADVEDNLTDHPGVLEAAVIAVPDPKWEERPLAILRLRPGVEVSDEELREHLLSRMARWQVPERWVRVDTIPKTGVGKIDKQLLRSRYSGPRQSGR